MPSVAPGDTMPSGPPPAPAPAPVPTSSSAPSSSPPHAAASPGCRGAPAPPPPPPPPRRRSCAACKHQRRKCPPDCLLNPYLVTDEPDKFKNAIQMFGVKNVQRILREVPSPRRDVCVRTIVYESNVRAEDPVRGCCGVIQDLEEELMDTAVELEVLVRRLESYRQMARGGSQPQPQPQLSATQPQAPYGVPPAASALTALQPQLSAVEPQLPEVQTNSQRRP